jgi:ubiquinol-cytochrome c reductase cytochrome b subunit
MIQKILQGGAEYGSLTLTRFYTLHVAILPALLVALLVMHVALFRRHGVTPPARADVSKVDPFYPHQLWKDVAAVLAVLVVVFVLAWREHGAPLDAPADPASDYPARPEWYFLSLFQMLKYFEGSMEVVGALVIPGAIGAFLVLLPWLDRGESRAIGRRLLVLAPLLGLGVGVVALTVASMRADKRDEQFQKSRKVASKRAESAYKLASFGVPPDGPLAMLRRDPDTRGPQLFQEHCASCHRLGELGPEPAKATAPDLSGFGTAEWVMSMLENPDAANRFANTPFKGDMTSLVHPPLTAKPGSFKPMPEADRRKIATFLAGEAAEVKDAQHDADGAKLVSQRCTSCHLFRGQTDDDDSSGPELAGWGSSAWVRAQIANPGTPATYRASSMSEGRKGHMPRFDDKLEPQEIALLADWVRREARATK